MKYLLLSSLLSLSGCVWQTVNSNDIETATKICSKQNATVVDIAAYFDGRETVTCSNRALYFIKGFE